MSSALRGVVSTLLLPMCQVFWLGWGGSYLHTFILSFSQQPTDVNTITFYFTDYKKNVAKRWSVTCLKSES